MKAPPVKAPTDRLSIILLACSAGLVVMSVAFGFMLFPLALPFALVFGALGFRQLHFGRAAVRTHAALQAITRGDMDEAEAHLAAIPRWFMRGGAVMRSALFQRALIAFYRGDAKAAAALLDPATDQRTRFATRFYESMQRTLVLSLRALALASIGETERARADVGEVLASPYATPEAIARARLAEAVIHGRNGETDALAALFRTHGSLVLEHAYPRERVLARALRKMARARARSVYREAARIEEQPSTGAIGEWIAQIAPDAAPHATEATRLVERVEVAAAPRTDEIAVRAVNEARQRAAKNENKNKPRIVGRPAATLALWVVLIVMFLVIYQFLTPSEKHATHATHAAAAAAAPTQDAAATFLTMTEITVPVVFVIVFAVFIVKGTRKLRKAERQIVEAQRALALGDDAAAEPLLVALEKERTALGPANALFLRAKRAEQHARFDECIAHCDRALGSIAGQVPANRMAASMTLTPAVVTLRGMALAAMGRAGEANAELATIAREHATWSHRVAAELRIRLLLAIRGGDLEAARTIARERTPELPITLRDEALADLVLATAESGASRDEQERLDGELAEDMTTRSWIDAVAPDLRAELARRVSGKNVRIEAGGPHAEIQADETDDETDEDGESQAAFRRV